MLDVHQQKRCCLTSTVVYRLFFLWHLSFKRSPCLWPPDRLSGAVKRKLLDVHCTSLRKSKFAAASGPMTRMSSISSGAEYDAWDQQWRGGLEMLLKMRGWQLEMKSCGPWKPTKIQRWFGLWIHIKWLPRTWYFKLLRSPFGLRLKTGEPLEGTPTFLPYGPRKMWMPSMRLFWVQVRRLHCEMGMMSCHAAVWIFHWHTERSDKVCGEIVLKC